MNRSIGRGFAAIGIVGTVVSTAPAMTFNVTNAAGASPQMVSAFTQATALWSARFNDPIIINIRIDSTNQPAGVAGHTDSFFDPYLYTDVRGALLNDRTTADDLSSTNSLQAGSVFSMLINKTANNPNGVVSATPYFDTGLGGPGQAGPENNNTVRITSANAKAIGLYPADSAGLDGIITFSNLNVFDFDRSNGINGAQVDFVGVAAHEIGHLLGFISGVDTLAGNAAAPGKLDNQLRFVTPIDLLRFSTRSIAAGPGVIDWTADDAGKYFSVDGGATPLAAFSTGAVYEESHWQNGMGLGLMNPTVQKAVVLGFSNNDLRAFDAIGYNLIPEPTSFALLGLASCMRLNRTRNPVRA